MKSKIKIIKGDITKVKTEAIKLAIKNKIKSIAFPSISTGAYGFPIEKAAPIALKEVRKFVEENDTEEEVIFVLFSEKDFQIYQNFYQDIFKQQEFRPAFAEGYGGQAESERNLK